MNKHHRRNIILEDLTFDFTDYELSKFTTYWNEYSKHSNNTIEKVRQISRDLNLSVDNTFLVILHLQREGKI